MGDLSGKSSGDQHAAKAVTCSSVDDQRAAAAIVTSLSGYVLTGSLAIIGAEIAIFALLVDKGRYPWWLFALYALTVVILLTSCYVGGMGVDRIAGKGFRGTWSLSPGGLFNQQLVLTLIGIAFFVLSIVLTECVKWHEEASKACS